MYAGGAKADDGILANKSPDEQVWACDRVGVGIIAQVLVIYLEVANYVRYELGATYDLLERLFHFAVVPLQ